MLPSPPRGWAGGGTPRALHAHRRARRPRTRATAATPRRPPWPVGRGGRVKTRPAATPDQRRRGTARDARRARASRRRLRGRGRARRDRGAAGAVAAADGVGGGAAPAAAVGWSRAARWVPTLQSQSFPYTRPPWITRGGAPTRRRCRCHPAARPTSPPRTPAGGAHHPPVRLGAAPPGLFLSLPLPPPSPSPPSPAPIMVSFCCDACQSVVKKPKAAAHLAACGRAGTLSCIDCGGGFTWGVRFFLFFFFSFFWGGGRAVGSRGGRCLPVLRCTRRGLSAPPPAARVVWLCGCCPPVRAQGGGGVEQRGALIAAPAAAGAGAPARGGGFAHGRGAHPCTTARRPCLPPPPPLFRGCSLSLGCSPRRHGAATPPSPPTLSSSRLDRRSAATRRAGPRTKSTMARRARGGRSAPPRPATERVGPPPRMGRPIAVRFWLRTCVLPVSPRSFLFLLGLCDGGLESCHLGGGGASQRTRAPATALCLFGQTA